MVVVCALIGLCVSNVYAQAEAPLDLRERVAKLEVEMEIMMKVVREHNNQISVLTTDVVYLQEQITELAGQVAYLSYSNEEKTVQLRS